MKSYRQFVMRLFKDGEHLPTDPIKLAQVHAAIGISGEAGELLDAVKKCWAYDQDLDIENVLEECGDLLFYITAMLDTLGYDLEDAEKHNYDKLNKRYPNGFTNQAAKDRADKQTKDD